MEGQGETRPRRGGFGEGRGRGRGGFEGRGRGRGAAAGAEGDRRGGRPPRKSGPPKEAGEKEWVPCTKLGRLVKDGKITSLEQIYVHAIPIREYQIIDHFFREKATLKDEVMNITPVQKQTAAGQRTRFKAWVVVGDFAGHCGLGAAVSSEVANAIRSGIIRAKLALIPVRKGYWGNKIGLPHTVPMKVTGKSGSVRMRLVPAARGSGIVAAPVPKKLLQYAGIEDVFSVSKGHTKTMGNFLEATYRAVKRTYAYLSPDLWAKTIYEKHPYEFINAAKK